MLFAAQIMSLPCPSSRALQRIIALKHLHGASGAPLLAPHDPQPPPSARCNEGCADAKHGLPQSCNPMRAASSMNEPPSSLRMRHSRRAERGMGRNVRTFLGSSSVDRVAASYARAFGVDRSEAHGERALVPRQYRLRSVCSLHTHEVIFRYLYSLRF